MNVPIDQHAHCSRLRILVADDHHLVREGVKLVLSQRSLEHLVQVVAEATCAESADAAERPRDRPAGAGPGHAGHHRIALDTRARDAHPDLHIIVMTANQDSHTRDAVPPPAWKPICSSRAKRRRCWTRSTRWRSSVQCPRRRRRVRRSAACLARRAGGIADPPRTADPGPDRGRRDRHGSGATPVHQPAHGAQASREPDAQAGGPQHRRTGRLRGAARRSIGAAAPLHGAHRGGLRPWPRIDKKYDERRIGRLEDAR